MVLTDSLVSIGRCAFVVGMFITLIIYFVCGGRGQLVGVGSFPPLYMSWELNRSQMMNADIFTLELPCWAFVLKVYQLISLILQMTLNF